MTVALVADSTAELGPGWAGRHGVHVVPLQVVVGDTAYPEGSPEVTPQAVAAALRERRAVSTSRPAPAVLAELYARLAEEGADEIVSVHVSSQVSGTFESAQAAARQVDVPVHCVNTAQIGPGTGFAVESAAAVLAAGGSAAEAAEAARLRSTACTALLYVDTLEYLRRGGRVGGAAALLGGALAVKPLLGISDGVVVPVARVRTAVKAIARLEALAVEAAEEREVEVAVAHLDAAERAADLVHRLQAQLGERLVGEVRCREIGAVLGAHVGPGMLAVCVAPVADA